MSEFLQHNLDKFADIGRLEAAKADELRRHALAMDGLKDEQLALLEEMNLTNAGLDVGKLWLGYRWLEITGKATASKHPRIIELVDTVITEAIQSIQLGKGTSNSHSIFKRRYVIVQDCPAPAGNGTRRQRQNRSYDEAIPLKNVFFSVGVARAWRAAGCFMPEQAEAAVYYLNNIKTVEEAKTSAIASYDIVQALFYKRLGSTSA